MRIKAQFSVKRIEYFGIFLGFLAFSAISAFIFLPIFMIQATEYTQNVGNYTLTMSMNSNVAINVTPTSTETSYSSANNLSVSNTCPYGMVIALSTNSNSNALINSSDTSKTIPATSGTTLGDNTWGFSKDGGSTWSAVPAKNGTAATVYSSSSAQTSTYTVPISFGVKVDSSIASGAYSTDVLYSMTPSSNCAGYNITWNFNGGSGKSGATYPTKMNNGQTIDLSAIKPTKTYYDFNGWSNGTNTFPATAGVTDINPNANTDITMTAQWALTEYNIEYNYDGGSCTNPKTKYTYETETFSLCTPTREGYDFAGWTGSNGTTAQTDVSIPQGSSGDKSYTANWTAIKYTISYDLNCTNATVTTNPSEYYITTNTFTLNNPSCPGHTFNGWTGSNGTTPNKTITISNGSTGNRAYTANWSTNTYTVSVTNGTFSDGLTSKSFAYGTTATATRNSSALPSCSSYTSWATYATDTQYRYKTCYSWNDNTTTKSITVTGNATISFGYYSYSSGTQYRYLVRFKDSLNTSYEYSNTWTDENGNFSFPSNPSKTGYTFKGWNTSSTATTGTTTAPTISAPRTYYAIWSINTYTVNVVNGKFSDGTTSKSLAYGATATIVANYDGTMSAPGYGSSVAYKYNGTTDWSQADSYCTSSTNGEQRYKYYNRLYFSEWGSGGHLYGNYGSYSGYTITVTGAATYTANFVANSSIDSGTSQTLAGTQKCQQTGSTTTNYGEIKYIFLYTATGGGRGMEATFNDGTSFSTTRTMGANNYAVEYNASTRVLHVYKTPNVTGTVNYYKELMVTGTGTGLVNTSWGSEGYSLWSTLCQVGSTSPGCEGTIVSVRTAQNKTHEASVTIPRKTVYTYGWVSI